jgi:hypothetical protein
MERSAWIVVGSAVIGAVLVVMGVLQMGKDASSGGSADITGGGALEAADSAKDQAAQSALRNALASAKTYFVEGASYDGWTPAQGQSIEPSIRWAGSDPVRLNVVSIDVASGEQVVMSTKSASGKAFCVADTPSGDVYGSVDASKAVCSGGW